MAGLRIVVRVEVHHHRRADHLNHVRLDRGARITRPAALHGRHHARQIDRGPAGLAEAQILRQDAVRLALAGSAGAVRGAVLVARALGVRDAAPEVAAGVALGATPNVAALDAVCAAAVDQLWVLHGYAAARAASRRDLDARGFRRTRDAEHQGGHR